MKKNLNSCILNFSCLVGSELGNLKIINGFDWTTEDDINLDIGPISVIKKYQDEYYLASLDKLYKLHSLLDEDTSVHYSPKANTGEIIGFDFFQEKTVIGFDGVVHIIKDNEIVAGFGNGKFNAFKMLRDGHVAVGGMNTEMSVFNILSHEKPVFTSKGEPNKGLSIPAKINITSIEQDIESDSIIYCGTKFNTVQLYDIRSNQRKAQLTANFERGRSVTALSSMATRKVIAGSNGGCLGIIDFKFVHKSKHNSSEFQTNYAKFKGFLAGTVSDLAVVNSVYCDVERAKAKDILLSTSIDGHLAVFDTGSREMLKKIYLGKKPLSILVDNVNENPCDDLWGDLDALEQDMDRKRPASPLHCESDKKVKKN